MIPMSQWLIMAKMYLLLIHMCTRGSAVIVLLLPWELRCIHQPLSWKEETGHSINEVIVSISLQLTFHWPEQVHWPNLVSVGVRNMVLSLVGSVDIVQTKFILGQFKKTRKILFKTIVMGEGDLNSVCTQLHKRKGGRVLRDGMVVWGLLAFYIC